ncbi:Tar ligand binding domain-containing protein, partial [Paraburkholderia sp. IW21]|uniref:Tar ligand binding domain-containing protein n=1 Tax=Paraburkholderia sp. IW21 TaxID=3242488 RepID=UPI003521E6E1
AELSISRERTTVDRIAFDPTAPTVDKDVATYRMLKGQGMEAWTQYLALPATSTESSLAAAVRKSESPHVLRERDGCAPRQSRLPLPPAVDVAARITERRHIGQ